MSKDFDALNGMYDQIETNELSYYNSLFEDEEGGEIDYDALNGMYDQIETDELAYYNKLFEGKEVEIE